MRSPEEQLASLVAQFQAHPEMYPSQPDHRYYVVLCDWRGKPVYGPVARRFHVHNQRLRMLALTMSQTKGLLVFPLE